MRQRDVAALDAKYTKVKLMLKLKMMLCVMMLPLVVVSCTSKRVCQSVRRPPPPPAWIMQPPRLWQTPLNGIISPQREADHCKKQLEEPRSILMSSADEVAHIDGQLSLMCEYALPAEYKYLKVT